MVHQYNSTTYGSVYRCTTVVLPNPLLVNRAPELTDFALQIALPHFMRIFLGRVLAHYHNLCAWPQCYHDLWSSLLKCPGRQTGPEYPTITLDFAYKSSFSLNHYVQSLRPAHTWTLQRLHTAVRRPSHPHAATSRDLTKIFVDCLMRRS